MLTAARSLFLLRFPHALPAADALGHNLLHVFGLLAGFVAQIAAGEGFSGLAQVLGPGIHRIRRLGGGAASSGTPDLAFPELVCLLDGRDHTILAHPCDAQPILDEPVAVAAAG